jgi:hypothetical protein
MYHMLCVAGRAVSEGVVHQIGVQYNAQHASKLQPNANRDLVGWLFKSQTAGGSVANRLWHAHTGDLRRVNASV